MIRRVYETICIQLFAKDFLAKELVILRTNYGLASLKVEFIQYL